MKISIVFIISLFSLSFGLQAQTMTLDEKERVGIRNTTPGFTLHVKHKNGTPAALQSNGITISHDSSSLFTWTLYSSATNNELRFYRGGIQEVTFSPDGGVNTLSDERAKTNISNLPDGQLERLLLLSPKMYKYKESPTQKTCIGFLAQDLYKVVPSVVNYIPKDDDGESSWMVSYTSLVPILVKGIQEQQSIIENQKKEIENLKQQQQQILERLEKLENN